MQTKFTFPNSAGQDLASVLNVVDEKQDNPIIINVHGFASNKNGSTSKVAAAFNQARFNTFNFDITGHGESEGEFADITISQAVKDLLSAIESLKLKGFEDYAFQGSSFGGLVCLLAATQSDPKFLILRAPVSNYADQKLEHMTLEQITTWREQGYINLKVTDKITKRVNYGYLQDFKRNDGYAAALEVAAPTLIVHGTNDQDVLIAQSRKLVKRLVRGELLEIKGAGHGFSEQEHFDFVLDKIVDFAKAHQ